MLFYNIDYNYNFYRSNRLQSLRFFYNSSWLSFPGGKVTIKKGMTF